MLTTTQAAKQTGLCSATIRAACRRGELAAVLLGKQWIFDRAALAAWLAQRAAVGPTSKRGRPIKSAKLTEN